MSDPNQRYEMEVVVGPEVPLWNGTQGLNTTKPLASYPLGGLLGPMLRSVVTIQVDSWTDGNYPVATALFMCPRQAGGINLRTQPPQCP